MATDKTNNLTAFLNDLADGIRVAETGSAASDNNDIPAQNFRSRIEAIPATATADADAESGDILSGKTAYVNGTKVTGTIATRTSSNLTTSGATVTVPAGYYASDASTSIAAGTYSASGGTLSVSSNYTGKPTVSLSLEGQTTTGAALETTEPENGYYLTVKGSSGALSGTTKVSRTAITKSATAGYVETGSSTVSSATSKSPTVTVQANSATNYITIPSGSTAVTGGGLSGGSAVTPTVTLSNGSDTNMSNITAGGKNTTNYPYYFKVNGASSSGSSTVTRAAVKEARTAGYIEDKAAADVIASASKTVTVNAGSGSTYVGLKAGGCSVAGGGLTINSNYSDTPEVTISLDGQTTTGAAYTTTKPSSGYYLTVGAASEALSGTTKVSSAAVTDTHTAGYIPAKSATTVIAASSKSPTVTVGAGSETGYITLPTGGCTVSGGGLSISNNYSGTPTVDITLDSQTTSGATITDTEPESGYYLTIGATSSALSGTTKVTRAAITDTHTAGYIPAKSATTVSSSTSKSPSVTINAGSKTEYVVLPTGGCTVSGGGLSGGSVVVPTVTLSSGSDTNMSHIIVGSKDTTNYPYYFKVNGLSSSGSSTVYRAAVTDTHTAGYIPAKSTTTVIDSASKTVTVNPGSGSTYVGLKGASLGAAGTASATTTVAPGTVSIANKSASVTGKTQITATPSTSTSDISTYYMAVNATAAANSTGTTSSISGTASASVASAGYAPTSLTGSGSVSGTATAKTSEKTSSTYYIPIASGAISASGSASASATVTPGAVTLADNSATVSGKTRIAVTPQTSTSISTPYYIAIKPSVAAGSGSISGSGTATAKGSTAGYITTSTSGSGSISVSGTATSSAKDGSVYYLPMAQATFTTSGASVKSSGAGYIPANTTVGTISSGSATTPTTTITATISGPSYNSSTGKYDISVSGSKSITPTVSAGYVSSGTAGTVSVSGSISIAAGVMSASGSATASATVTPGSVTLADNSASVSGKTRIAVSPQTSTSISTPYYIAIKPSVAAGSASISGSGTATAKGSTAGYITTSTSGTGSISVSGTATSSAKDGSVYYLPMAQATFTTSGASVKSSGAGYIPANTTVGTISSGSATTPTTSILATPSISVDNDGIVTAVAQGSESITPTVSAGYISSGTAGTVSVDSRNSYQLSTVTPGYDFYKTSDGKIGAQWTCTTPGWVKTGSYSGTVNPTTLDSNLKAENIANGISIFGITGTHAQFNATTLEVTPTLNAQVFHASDSGYQGYSEVTVNGMPNGALKTPTGSITNSTGKVSISSGVSTSGYIGTNSTKSGSLQLTTQAAQTITPGTTNKTISAYRWLTGTQTIKGDSNLVAGNIKSGITIFGVTGTYTGSGSSTTVSTGSLELRGVPGEAKVWVPRLSSGSITYGSYTGGNRTISNVVLNAPFFVYMGLGSAPYIYKDTSGVTDIGSDLNDAGYYSGVLTSSSGYVDFWYDCCFDGQSKVLMADNTEKTLVDVAIGDMVMTYDEITGASAANEVTALGTVELDNIAEIILADDIAIRMNIYHPMWTEEGWKSIVGYKGLPRLTTEDKLLNNNGEYIAIKSIERVDIDKQTYYTLKVANNNNFYVNGYLAQGKDKD